MLLTAIVPATNDPATLGRCLQAIRDASDPPDELLVIDDPDLGGPAAARNAGAWAAGGEILVFVDADVEVHADVFTRIRAVFADDPGLSAVFGSYDDQPRAPGVVSVFRNLLHHDVHQAAGGPAQTFWAGLGAVRRDAFLEVGGFDAVSFDRPSVEDIDLGMRLAASGRLLLLDPRIQGTHLKAWNLVSMLRTDLFSRGIPWIGLLLRHRSASGTLNLGWRHRLSAGSCVFALTALAAQQLVATILVTLLLVALNRRFYGLLLRRGGPLVLAAGIGLHVLHHLTAVAAVPLGIAAYVGRSRRTPEAPAPAVPAESG